jgi:hypothetical protein
MDLFYWALFGYWMLSRGDAPFLEGPGIPTPIRLHLPALSPDLAHALEACLAWQVKDRPETATEIRSALLLSPGNLRKGTDLELSGVAAGQAFQALVEERRRSGRLVPEEMRQGIDTVGLAPALEVEAPERLPVPVVLGEPVQTVEFPPASPGRDAGVGQVLGGLAVGILLGVGVLFLRGKSEPSTMISPSSAISVRSPPPTPSEAPAGDSDSVSLAPSQQAAYRRDPAVHRLLGYQQVTKKDFRKVWSILRTCVLGKKLPPSVLNEEGLMELRNQGKRDLPRASRELQDLLKNLRKQVGYPGEEFSRD